MPGGNYKTKKLIFISVAMFLAAIFASIPLATNGEHCDAHTKDSKDVLCLENQYPKIPLPKIGDTSLFDKGPYSLNDIAEKVKTPFNTIDPLSGLIYYLFAFSVSVVGIVAFGAIIYAGVMLMMSGARPQLRMDAKNKIRNVILGIALLLGSVILLNTINPELSIINVPGADKGSGLKFDLPEEGLQKQVYEAQKKSFARKCIGPDTFTKHITATHFDVAEIICSGKNVAPIDVVIHRALTGMVNKTECNDQDVEKISQIIKSSDTICGKGKAPSKEVIIIIDDQGDIRTVTLDQTTVPADLCIYTGTSGSGAVYGTTSTPKAKIGKLIESHLRRKEAELLNFFRDNLLGTIEYCKKQPTRPACTLTDGTPITNFEDQQEMIVQYCYEITGKEHTTF